MQDAHHLKEKLLSPIATPSWVWKEAMATMSGLTISSR